MRQGTIRGLRILAVPLIVVGIGLAVYSYSVLHSLEFGPAGYLCPAYVCTLDEVWQAGYGGYVEGADLGLAMLVAGMLILAGSLIVRPGRRLE